MIVCICCDGDQFVCVFFDGFVCKGVVDDIMQCDVVVIMCCGVYFGVGVKVGDLDWYFVVVVDFDVVFQLGIVVMYDLIDRKGCGGMVGIGLIVLVQFFGDLGQLCVQQWWFVIFFVGVQGWKVVDDVCFVLCDDQFWF